MEDSQEIIRNDYTEIIRPLTLKTKVSYGVGHVLNDICASMWFTYLLVFFYYVLGFDASLSGAVLLIGQVADALATPFVGLHSDKNDDFWLCRYGRRKSWHLIGTVCVIFAFPFIFSECLGCKNSHQWAQLVYYAAFVIIFQFGWASVQISHLSLIADLTPKNEERTLLTAIRYGFTVFSNILVYCVTWAVLHLTSVDKDAQIGPQDLYKFRSIVLIGLAVGVFMTIIFHVFVSEENNYVPTGGSQRTQRLAGTLLKDIQLYHLACVYTSTRLFVNLSQVYVPMYLHETLHMAATSLAIIPLIMYLSSFKSALVIEYLNTKCGRKIAYLLGATFSLSACAWIWFGKGHSFIKLWIYPLSLLLGAGGSFMLVTSLGLTADYIGQHTESGAFVYGMMSFADKLCNGVAVFLIQYFKCSDGCQNYYQYILTFICGGAALIGLVSMLTMQPFVRDYEFNTLNDENTNESSEERTSTAPEIFPS